jgi:hypothetical protein
MFAMDTIVVRGATVIDVPRVGELWLKVTVLGEQRLVGPAEAVCRHFGWELRVSTQVGSSAYIVTAKVPSQLPVRVGFHIIPDDWAVNRRSSVEDAASVWFIAESVDEAKALENLGKLEWLSYQESLVQFALKPGYTQGDAAVLGERAR